ncbi:MAG: hypothetical protein ACOYMA_02040 [Bacteroidia bacterium]
MKNTLYLIVCCILILFSCKQKAKTTQNTAQPTTDTANQSNGYFNYQNTIIHSSYSDTVFVKFSSDSLEDCFTFYMPDGNINKTKSIIRITTKNGELIYEKVFQTNEIVNGYATYDILNDSEMEQYVLTEAKNVLAKTSFLYINNAKDNSLIKQTNKEDIQDYETFLECKNENRPLFCFRLYEENITYIGYSKIKKKVIDLIYCC